jgi:NTE family protein
LYNWFWFYKTIICTYACPLGATALTMSLETNLSSALPCPDADCRALVLMGGGARTAYQAGVLQALASLLRVTGQYQEQTFPFKILVGTSAGALNATYLASRASEGLPAFTSLANFWYSLRSEQVYHIKVPAWIRSSRLAVALFLSQQVRKQQAFLNNMPLVNTLHSAIALGNIDAALQDKTLHALAVTASSYSSGVHWTFCQTSSLWPVESWSRPGRRADLQPITIEHLMASSALPFIFPATPLWVDGRCEYFGDGSMRQSSPLSPAVHLGASKVMVIGVGQPERAGLAGGQIAAAGQRPSLGAIAGHAMASVFQDTLQADVEQAQRITQTLRKLPREVALAMPYRPVDILAISPSQSLDELAQAHAHELTSATYNALSGLGALGEKGSPSGAAIASYLLFEPGFVQALMALGERDAYARRDEILAFFDLKLP